MKEKNIIQTNTINNEQELEEDLEKELEDTQIVKKSVEKKVNKVNKSTKVKK